MSFVVLFRNRHRPGMDEAAYEKAFEQMYAIVSEMDGFISIEGFTGEDGSELALVRFDSDEAIEAWKSQPDHVRTQQRGRDEFYSSYDITVAEVTRAYSWSAPVAEVAAGRTG
ncbi:antibiotic biosynthesis monooxygenase family protein [Kribbella sp. C-35]|uniref:antibiotic biosynthesis monooxygenase family protein n=1 Tax=Kribbella sp. C-35 TaxID=2789276 RepID=UPI003979EC25